jgi:SAM-dependent methyltransferase
MCGKGFTVQREVKNMLMKVNRKGKDYAHSTPKSVLVSLGFVVILLVLVSTATGALSTGRMYPPRGRSLHPGTAVGPRSLSSLKTTFKYAVRSFGDSSLVAPLLYHPQVKKALAYVPGSRLLYFPNKWDRKHPFDRAHGTDTSGFVYGQEMLTGHPAEEHGSPYAGVQPSVLRTVLSTMPNLDRCTFIDLGCGKGRPMLIASEFPFRDIVGVELSPMLVKAARWNADVIAQRYPERTKIRVVEGDATVFPMPDGDVILFLYNSFDHELTAKVAEGVKAALEADSSRSIYVVYCNPASGDCFDGLAMLARRYARTLPYAPGELGFAEDAEDAVIVWQGGSAPPPEGLADAKIVIIKERWRAGLAA